ncbi:MAG: thiamine pyrophosphate-dependent enzyme [archaeon]
MNRQDVIEIVLKNTGKNDLIVSCSGFTSRSLFSLRDRKMNFYMLGSMGLASSIGLGYALCKPRQKVYVLDGDANILMNLASLLSVGKLNPKNFIHVLLDNEVNESTGGQPTLSREVDIEKIAGIANYGFVKKVKTITQLRKALRTARKTGPSFILAKIEIERIFDCPRISVEPTEISSRIRREFK